MGSYLQINLTFPDFPAEIAGNLLFWDWLNLDLFLAKAFLETILNRAGFNF